MSSSLIMKRLWPPYKQRNWPLTFQQIKRSYAAPASAADKVEHTALYDFHVQHGGKIVNFGGYALPVQYADQGIAASHLHTRAHASIFDVSHMLQTYVHGKDAIECIESICTADIHNTSNANGSLTVFTNSAGCILDDLIVTRVNDKQLYVVSNAAMKQQDMALMEAAVAKRKAEGKDVSIEFLSPKDQSLIALQGPSSVKALANLTKANLQQLYFMTTIISEVAGVNDCRITRCGYTGEDGVEISVPSSKIKHVTESLLQQTNGNVKMAGLGARDSLRLEAGLCLYGNDIDSNTTPIEGALAWLVAKRRRAELNFPGAEIIVNQLKSGVQKRRIGLKLSTAGKPPPARSGAHIYHNNVEVGYVTSGCPSPSLGFNIAMGYIKEELKQAGTKVQVKIRDRFYDAEVAKMPFTKTNYFMKPK
uniref:Aminomethyltransferase n=1 Tax=Glossina morsitans morsitans TaxID=37546 RepID=D3TLX4_GLOMM